MPWQTGIESDPHRRQRKTQPEQIETEFAAKNWPHVSLQMIEMVGRYVEAHVPVYQPGTTSEQALGALATHGGMVYLHNALRKVHAEQQRAVEKKAIHTHTSQE